MPGLPLSGGRLREPWPGSGLCATRRDTPRPADFIQPEENRSGPDRGVTAWTWRSLPEPALGSLPPRGQAWEMTRYRAYQAQLAGHTIGETFGRAAAFLKLAAPHLAAA